MGQALSPFIQGLVSEEIRRMVAQAIQDGGTVSSSAVAAAINRTYPNCGLSEREMADEVMIAAAKAGVAVEIGQAVVVGQTLSRAKNRQIRGGNGIRSARQ